ncbi:hypothetical protein K523DRAFT_313134 [Schizophyllum commune Tattone D]|nr:hypothetical protein K523DRAFT_313134 [Schizophyllum commune Tattone D]
MDRSFAPVWRACMQRIPELPPKPEHLDEPDYVNKVYGDHCSFCSSPNWSTVAWSLMLRFCKQCLLEKFTEVNLFSQNHKTPALLLEKHVNDFVPMIYIGCKGPNLRPSRISANIPSPIARLYILTDDLKKFNKEYMAVRSQQDKFQQWVNQRVTAVKSNIAFGEQCGAARKHHDTAEDRKLQAIRDARYNQIVAEIKKSEIKDELKYAQSALEEHPLVNKAQPLTDDQLPIVVAELFEFLEEHKKERLEKVRLQNLTGLCSNVYRDYTYHISKIRPDSICMPICDLLLTPPYQAYIHYTPDKPLGRRPEHKEITELSKKWREAKDIELANIVAKALKKKHADVQFVNLATTFFECKVDSDSKRSDDTHTIGCPHILVTEYATRPHYGDDKRDELVYVMDETPWNFQGERVVFDAVAHKLARDVVHLAGLDPDKATRADMDARDAWFVCTGCSKRGYRRVMQWYQAIRHIRPAADHWKGLCESGKPALQVLDEKDAVRAAAVKADQWKVPGLARKDRRRGRAAEDAPKSTSVRMIAKDLVIPLDKPDVWEYVLTK